MQKTPPKASLSISSTATSHPITSPASNSTSQGTRKADAKSTEMSIVKSTAKAAPSQTSTQSPIPLTYSEVAAKVKKTRIPWKKRDADGKDKTPLSGAHSSKTVTGCDQ